MAWAGNSTTEKVGTVLQLVIPAIGLGTTLYYEDGYEGTKEFARAFGTTVVVTEALKLTVQKRRPNGNCCDSFPSGHTSVAFMGAAFIQERYGWEYAVPAYAAATYVGYSRVYADQHDWWDVAAGAAIGVASSFWFTTSYEGFTVTPVAGGGVYGLTFSRRW